MAIDWGFNFRANKSYVTDGANEVTIGSTDGDATDFGHSDPAIYPSGYFPGTSSASAIVGWSAGPTTRDRDSGLDRRLAGLQRVTNANDYFQIDLPSTGSYDIWLACGDGSFQVGTAFDLMDGATVFQSISNSSDGAAHFRDATDTDYSAASWPGSNTKITRTFGSTTFKINARNVTFDGTACLAHVRIATAAGGGGFIASPFPIISAAFARGGF